MSAKSLPSQTMVQLAVVLAVPMYANAAGIVPIIEVFVAKGIPLGTAIAFFSVFTPKVALAIMLLATHIASTMAEE